MSDTEIEHLRRAVELSGVNVPEITTAEQRHLILGQMRFTYYDWGSPGRPHVLFLHGGGLTSRTWDLVCLALRRQCHCLAFDQRGHGDSEWSPIGDYSIDAHRRDIERFVDQLGLEQFVLVGMSMGGLNAMAYAGRHSHRLAGLVIVDISPDIRVAAGERIREYVDRTGQVASVEEFVRSALEFNPLRDRQLLERSVLQNLRQLPDGRWVRKTDLQQFSSAHVQQVVKDGAHLWEDVSRISCPTLVIRGAQSQVFLEEDARKLVGSLRNARATVVEGAGHTVQGDNPRGFVDALNGFLRDIFQRGEP